MNSNFNRFFASNLSEKKVYFSKSPQKTEPKSQVIDVKSTLTSTPENESQVIQLKSIHEAQVPSTSSNSTQVNRLRSQKATSTSSPSSSQVVIKRENQMKRERPQSTISVCDLSFDSNSEILTDSVSSSSDDCFELEKGDPAKRTIWPSEGARWSQLELNHYLICQVVKRFEHKYHLASVGIIESISDSCEIFKNIKEDFKKKTML